MDGRGARRSRASGHGAAPWLVLAAATATVGAVVVVGQTQPHEPAPPGTDEPASPPPAWRGEPKQGSPGSTVGWELVTSDDFEGSALDSDRWETYAGVPGCCPDALWDASQVSVSDGILRLANSTDASGTWLSGGVGSWDWPESVRTYGRYEARIRMDAGQGFTAAALLWPADNEWPPELDFWEILQDAPDRETMRVTTHWRDDEGEHAASHTDIDGDFTQWHVARVDWLPHRVVYYLDGVPVRVERAPERIPDDPMWLGLQTHAHELADGAMPPSSLAPVVLHVDWVRVYAPARDPS